jgi:hypothetical protein
MFQCISISTPKPLILNLLILIYVRHVGDEIFRFPYANRLTWIIVRNQDLILFASGLFGAGFRIALRLRVFGRGWFWTMRAGLFSGQAPCLYFAYERPNIGMERVTNVLSREIKIVQGIVLNSTPGSLMGNFVATVPIWTKRHRFWRSQTLLAAGNIYLPLCPEGTRHPVCESSARRPSPRQFDDYPAVCTLPTSRSHSICSDRRLRRSASCRRPGNFSLGNFSFP